MTAIKSKQANEITHINALNLYGNTRISALQNTNRQAWFGRTRLPLQHSAWNKKQPILRRTHTAGNESTGGTHAKMGVWNASGSGWTISRLA